MKIYTKTGDKGDSGLFGGKRIRKSDVRLHAYGTVDELNAILGVILAEDDLTEESKHQLLHIQSLLFIVGSDLATPVENKVTIPRVTADHAKELERWIDAMDATLPPLQNFILPGGSASGALLHQARTVCRRAERYIVELEDTQSINHEVVVFINRLSDYLFVLARFINHERGITETPVILR